MSINDKKRLLDQIFSNLPFVVLKNCRLHFLVMSLSFGMSIVCRCGKEHKVRNVGSIKI